MDVSGRKTGTMGVDVNKLLASLGGGGGSGKRSGVWFEVGDTSESSPFLSFRRYSDCEIEFKEYDDLGRVTSGGVVEFDQVDGRVDFVLKKIGEFDKVLEGWLALDFSGEKVEVYGPWRLVGGGDTRKVFERVLAGYLYLKEAEFEGLGGEVEFENVGVGLSGEEEGHVSLRVKARGRLKSG